MAISAAEAIGPAFSRMKQICFQPFSVGKWFVMGFCAFLSTCGEGANPNFTGSTRSGGGGGGGPSFAEIRDFIATHLPMVIAIAIVGFLLIAAIWLAITYLRCRGRFMLLDNIVQNRAAVVEPWRQYGAQAMSYFWFCIVVHGIGLLVTIIALSSGLALALPDFRAGVISGLGIAAIILVALLIVPTGIILGTLQLLAYDFVVPVMMVRKTTFRPAWAEVRKNVLRGHTGVIILFYLLKIVLGIASAMIAFLAICATCCIGALPYLNAVLLLPVYVFSRTFALAFLEQFHPDYALMVQSPIQPTGFPIESSPLDPNEPPQIF